MEKAPDDIELLSLSST